MTVSPPRYGHQNLPPSGGDVTCSMKTEAVLKKDRYISLTGRRKGYDEETSKNGVELHHSEQKRS
jgi:hypothetical protein